MTQTKAELLQTRHQGDIRLGDADSSHYVGFKAPATVGTSLVWTLPAADGTAGYYLKTDGSGNLGWSVDNTGVTLSGSTNNTIATVSGANALVGEATFTYDGASTLEVKPASATPAVFVGDSDRTSAGQHLAEFRGYWDGTNVARLVFRAGTDTTNKDDGLIAFYTTTSGGSSTERARIDSEGRLLVGVEASRAVNSAQGSFQIEGTGAEDSDMSIIRNQASAGGPALCFGKSRNASLGGNTVVVNDDQLGAIIFTGNDGTDLASQGARIDAYVDGSPGSNDMPGRLTFSTTADGAATTTERMRIDSSGRLLVGTNAARTAIGATGAPALQVEGLGASDAQISIVRNSDTAAGPYFAMAKTRGTSDGANTIVQADDTLGTLYFTAADGVDINQQSAFVRCQVDGTPGANDTPGRLIFSTTADGGVTPTERLRISSTGVSKFTGGISQVATAAGALDLDLRTSNYFTKTISGNSTFTFSNPAASGTVSAFTLELTHSSGSVTWPGTVKWNGDAAPTLTAGKTHLFMFVTDDGGSRYRGSALVDYVN